MFWERVCVYKLLKDILVDTWKNQELQKAKVVKIQIPLLIRIMMAVVLSTSYCSTALSVTTKSL